ncbi:MAG: hypothetical protein WEB58_06010 [Planctomycetaceae bacterium]
MTSEPSDPASGQGEHAERTAEKPAVSPVVATTALSLKPPAICNGPKAQEIDPVDPSPTSVDDSDLDDDTALLEMEIDAAAHQSPKKQRRKSIRLAAIWWQRGCWKIGQTYHRFPGWTAATFAAGVAVVLSLMLLLIHFVWTAGPEDQNLSVAIGDDAAESETLDELELIAELGETSEDESIAERPSDNDDPFDAKPPKATSPKLAIEMSGYLLAGHPDDDERFVVSSQEFHLPADGVDFPVDELAAADPLWQPFDSIGAGTFEGDDVISVSKNSSHGDDELWKEVDGKRSRLASSEEASPLLASLNDIRLTVEPLRADAGSDRNIQGVVSGWIIKNGGSGAVEMLMVDKKLPAGLLMRKGIWQEERFVPSDWHMVNLAANSAQTAAFTVHPEPSSEDDRFSAVVDPFGGGTERDESHRTEPTLDESRQVVEATARVHVGGAVSAETVVDAPHLKLSWTLPESITAGKLFVIGFEIENTGVVPVGGIRIEADLGEGLKHRYGRRIMYKVGALASGQKCQCQMFLTAETAGEFEQQVRLTADGTLFQEETLSFEAGDSATATGPNDADPL